MFVAAERENRKHHQGGLHADEAAEAGVPALELLHDQPVLDIAHPGASVAFQVSAEEAELTQLRNQFARETGVTEAVADQRQHAFIHKLPRRLPDHQLLFAELRVDRKIIHTGESRHVRTILPCLSVRRGMLR